MPAAPLTRREAEVAAVRFHGGLLHLTCAVPDLPAARPGQLVALADTQEGSPLLPAVTWIHGAGQHAGHGAFLDVLVDRRRADTAWLARLAPGHRVLLTAPLGRGFRLPASPVPALLVADGAAAAPLLWLAEVLRARGCTTQLLLVGDSVDDVPGLAEARRSCDELVLATRDGATSHGARVPVGEVLEDLLRRTAAAVGYIAGPVETAAEWTAAAERAGLTTQVGIERPMACGIGLCDGCRVPVVGPDGRAAGARLCAEGPVLPAGRIAWDLLREEAW